MGIDTSMGFVAFPRGLTTWEWYDDPNTCRLFFHLMLTANWEPKNWHGIVIEPGSRVASIQGLATETGLTIQNVRTSLKRLKSTGYLTIKTTNKYSVVSINRWLELTGSNRLSNNQLTFNQQTSNNQLTTTKPLKQINNITSSFPIPPSQQGEAPQEQTAPPPQLPSLEGLEDAWRELGLGRRMGPVVQQALRAYLAAGLEDALIVQAMREAAEHDVKATLPYIRSILDRCQAQGISTLEAWQASHRSGGGKRVDRPEPSGNNFLSDAIERPRRHKRKE